MCAQRLTLLHKFNMWQPIRNKQIDFISHFPVERFSSPFAFCVYQNLGKAGNRHFRRIVIIEPWSTSANESRIRFNPLIIL